MMKLLPGRSCGGNHCIGHVINLILAPEISVLYCFHDTSTTAYLVF